MADRAMVLSGKHLIDGVWSSESNEVFDVLSPENGSTLGPCFSEATDGEVERAVDTANRAFLVSRETPPASRVRFLNSLADAIEAEGHQLLDRCISETGYQPLRAKGELQRTITQTRQFALVLEEGSWVNARIDRADGARRPIPKPDVRSMLQPLGAVGVMGASNFPFAISVAGTDTVTALAVGCSVVVKAHPAHAGTCEMLAEIIRHTLESCGLPLGLFSLIQGKRNRVGERLVTHPALRALAFTGSESGGRALCKLAANRVDPIPVFAEMGSVNPVVVLPEAAENKTEEIAKGFLDSLLLGGGQFCTNPGLLLVPDTEAGDKMTELIKIGIRNASVPTLLHRGISKGYTCGVENRLEGNPGQYVESENESGSACAARPAMISLDAKDVQPRMLKELFGPFSVLVRWRNAEEIMGVIGQLSGQLTCTLHAEGNEWGHWCELVSELQLKSGRFLMNGFPTGVEPGHAMHHGGPFPAASLPHFTSIGMGAITRFTRPMCYQDLPNGMLPDPLVDKNPLGIMRLIDGRLTREPIRSPVG